MITYLGKSEVFEIAHMQVTLARWAHGDVFFDLRPTLHPGKPALFSGPVEQSMAAQLRALADRIDDLAGQE